LFVSWQGIDELSFLDTGKPIIMSGIKLAPRVSLHSTYSSSRVMTTTTLQLRLLYHDDLLTRAKESYVLVRKT
jgi:hypothetical protein